MSYFQTRAKSLTGDGTGDITGFDNLSVATGTFSGDITANGNIVGNGLKVLRANAGATAYELAAESSSVVPGSTRIILPMRTPAPKRNPLQPRQPRARGRAR
jgi:hypothetical protein